MGRASLGASADEHARKPLAGTSDREERGRYDVAARSNRRRFVNSFALSARLRQRSACAFKKLVSILPPNATNHPILCDVLG